MVSPAFALIEGCTITIGFTGEPEPPIIVPDGVTQIELDIFGASGGDATGNSDNIGQGGNGAGVIDGVLPVKEGDVLSVIVGGKGGPADTGNGTIAGGDGGFGWIGGSASGEDSGGDGGDGTAHAGGGGGGSSAVLLNGNILAAAGGGGGGAHGGDGGAGGIDGANGTAVGRSTEQSQIGIGATAIAAGAGGLASDSGTEDGAAGGQGFGGAGGDAIDTRGGPSSPDGDAGGGGGGGLFGGGGAGGGGAAGDGGGAGGGGGSTSNNIPGAIDMPGSQNGDGYVDITLALDECPGDLQIEKSVSNPAPAIGEEFTYTLVATNNGPVDPDTEVVVTDNLPAGVSYVSDDCGGVNQPGVWEWDIGSLAIDDPQTCNIIVTAEEAGTWNNNATITGFNPDGNPDNNRAEVEIVVPPQEYDLEIDKVGIVESNGKITYTLTVTNNGPDDTLIAVGVVDALPPAVEYDSDTCNGLTPDIEPPNGGTFWAWNIGPMTADQVATCSITVNVLEPGDIENCAVVASHGNEVDPGLTNNAACVTVSIEPMLDIVKSVDPADELLPGESATYSIEVTNVGNFNYTDETPASVDDALTTVLDDATFNDDATATAGQVSYSEPILHWEGSLAIGSTVTITFTVTVDDPPSATGDGLLTNVVTGSPGQSNCVAGTETGCTTTVPVRALEIEKTVEPVQEIIPGGTLTYTVSIENVGQVPYTAAEPARFTDNLTAVLDDAAWDGNVTITPNQGTATFTAPNLVWEGPLAPGQTVTVTYTLTVKDPPTGDAVLVNTVVGPPESNCDLGTETGCTTTLPQRELTIAKTSAPATGTEVLAGGTVNYSVTVTNTGQVPYTAGAPATVDDDLTAVLDDATFNNDAAAGVGEVTFTDPILHWEGPLAPGASATITYSVTVNEPLTGDGILTNAVTGPPESNCDLGTETGCTTTVPVRALQIVKTIDPGGVALPGQTQSYTITVTNTGQVPYSDTAPATITDDLTQVVDDATYTGDATADVGTVDDTAVPILSWSGPLAVGETATITYSVTTNDPPNGNGILINTVTGPPESNCDQAPRPVNCRTISGVRQYSIVKEASVEEALPGDVVNYTVTVTNETLVPKAAADFTDDLSGVLDDAVYNGDAAATAGEVTVAEPLLSWSGPLGPAGTPSGTVTVTYSVTVDDPFAGDAVLDNVVTGPENSTCLEPTEPGCSSQVPIRALFIDKTADPDDAVSPGDPVTYTVTVQNIGGIDYTADHLAAFTDDMTDVLDDATFNDDQVADAGTVSYTEPILTWQGPLVVGEIATITYSVNVNDPANGDDQLVNNVTGPPEGNCSCSIVTPVRSMELAKTSDTTQAEAGEVITYTVTVTNTGQAPCTETQPASFTDDMTDVLDDATFNQDALASAGSTTFQAPTLSWSGPLPVGATVKVTYSVTVNDPPTGDGQVANQITSDSPGSSCEDSDEVNCRTLATITAQPQHPPLPNTGARFASSGLFLGLAFTGLGVLLLVLSQNRRQVD